MELRDSAETKKRILSGKEMGRRKLETEKPESSIGNGTPA